MMNPDESLSALELDALPKSGSWNPGDDSALLNTISSKLLIILQQGPPFPSPFTSTAGAAVCHLLGRFRAYPPGRERAACLEEA
eukprot:SAG31_NODE_37003_length_308_cov_0.885167_1_plen_83_part_10